MAYKKHWMAAESCILIFAKKGEACRCGETEKTIYAFLTAAYADRMWDDG